MKTYNVRTKHTPGPLKSEYIQSPMPRASHEFRVSAEAGGIVAWVDTAANASLFAAAPELLAALEAVLSMHCMPTEPHRTYRDNIGAMDKARTALAKANRVG